MAHTNLNKAFGSLLTSDEVNELLRVDDNGNVSIGSTTADSGVRLTIVDTKTGNHDALIENKGTGSGDHSRLRITTDNTGGDAKITLDTGNGTVTTLGQDNSDGAKFKIAINADGLLETDTAFIIDTDGIIKKPLQPAFQVTKAAQNNIAVGSQVTVTWNAEVFDQNSDFDLTTEAFTAPVTGKYLFSLNIRIDDVDTAADNIQLRINTSNRNYSIIIDPGPLASDPSHTTMVFSVLADMDASDTAIVEIIQTAGAAQMDIVTTSWWSGFLQS